MSTSVFSLCYAVVSVCFVFKTKEFEAAGLTIENIFERILGKENDDFVTYHVRRTFVTRLIHSLLLPGYLFGLHYFHGIGVFELSNIWWSAFVVFAFTLPLYVVLFSLAWTFRNVKHHPLSTTLQKFARMDQSWEDVAEDINTEYKSVDKVCIRTSSITKVVATPHWVIKLSPYTIELVHQSYLEMEVNQADTFQRSADGDIMVQYINILVKCRLPGIKSFKLRMNAMDFVDLQNRVQSNILILDGVHFRKNTMEQFLEVFGETVRRNPSYEVPREMESEIEKCIGCLQQTASVKLNKCCTGSERCVNCMCRPLWCLDCMGRWWASRQDQQAPETWLSSTCTCPICRSVFCILDVCPLRVLDS
uniref:Transmembrane protein 129 n=1 Tax=Lygus hesperus TaxID=30085 RepID=A0A0A9X5Y7_LYGHE